MGDFLRVVRVAFVASAAFFAHDANARGWLEETWNRLADAAHDVVTLGQHGRDRDRERAEAELRRTQEAQAAAERLRQAKIEALQKDAALLRDVVKAFESSAKVVREVGHLQEQALLAAADEIAARQQAFWIFEKVRDYRRSNSNDMLEILDALNSVPFLTEGDLTATFGPPGDRDVAKLEALKAKQEVAIDALRKKVDVAEKIGATEAVFLEQVVKRIKTDGLNAIVNLAQQSRVRLKNLGDALEASRRTYRQQLTVQIEALVALQAGDRATLAAQYENDLQPLNRPPDTAALSSNTLSLVSELAALTNVKPLAFRDAPSLSDVRICMSFNRGCF